MRSRIWLCAALAVLPLAGCTTTAKPVLPPSTPARPALKLVAFDSCAQLLTELRDATRRSVGPSGLPGDAVPEAWGIAGGTRRASVADQAVPVPAQTHSGTNVHEQGVDEPDIVKTDGRRIVTVADGVLRVIDPVTRSQTGRLDLGPDASGQAQLLLSGNRALVLVSGGDHLYRERLLRPPSAAGGPEVLLVDITGTPRLISRYRGEGTLVDARQTGDVARVVLSTTPKIKFPFTATTEAGLLTQNQKAVGAAPIDAWLPQWEVTAGADTTSGRVGCSAVSRPSSFSGAAMLTILTFGLNAPALTDGDPLAVVADGDTVYGTPNSLYVANNQGWWFNRFPSRGGAQETEIFQFALPATGKPVLTASGSVPGSLVNQYAMSEWDGYLRVATTDDRTSSSAVRVLRGEDGQLVQVGSVGGLGKGERIYSVRFIGSRGYVVTFRQTDPLYSIDLGDPAHPRVAGELKITGYSAHLQPVGDDRLIGIGQEASADGVRQGLQVSLFDVSDAARPERIGRQVLPGAGSQAEFDPHAILYWPATRLLVLPVMDSGGDNALALRVGDGLTTAGRIAAPPVAGGTPVTRALVVGDQLWTLTESGLAVSDLSTLDRTGWVPFA